MIAKRSAARRHSSRRAGRRWVKTVTIVSTVSSPGLLTRDAVAIAPVLASPRVSPKGPTSSLRMLCFYVNRAGRQLSRARRAEFEKTKRLMCRMIAARQGATP